MNNQIAEIKEQPRCLNVPAIEVYRSNKDEERNEKINLSLNIKDAFEDSRMPNFNVTSVMKLCKCNYKHAKRMFDLALKDDYFFKYNEKDESLTARSLNRKHKKQNKNKYGEDIWDIDVYKIRRYRLEGTEWVKIPFSRKYIERELKKLQILAMIEKWYGKDKNNRMYKPTLFIPYHKQIGKKLGVSEKTVSRMIEELVKENRIEVVEKGGLKLVGNPRSDGDEAIKEKTKNARGIVVNPDNKCVFEVIPTTYRPTSRQRCKTHIMLNHKNRKTHYLPKSKNGEYVMDECLNDKWDR